MGTGRSLSPKSKCEKKPDHDLNFLFVRPTVN